MMTHGKSVFRNSCIKTPVDPSSKLPSPSFERPPSAVAASSKSSAAMRPNSSQIDSNKLIENVKKENKEFMSMMDFYQSIPDYSELNHLSNHEFHKQIDTLKKKQMALRNNCWMEVPVEKCDTRKMNQSGETYHESRLEKNLDQTEYRKTPSKSVRINSGKSGSTTCFHGTGRRVAKYHEFPRKYYRSQSESPPRTHRHMSPSITVPKPFQMTQREEEDSMFVDLIAASKCSSPKTSKRLVKSTVFRANPVPLSSKVPLFDHIMEEQEKRNQLAKLSSAIELQSQMKPFSFADKPTASRSQSRCLSRVMSTPDLQSPCEARPMSNFKAKPCPKNLFSNYFYQKMWEDDYFRSMNKKIRAEEMLKLSSLPPSMAKRSDRASKSSNDADNGKRKKRRQRKCKRRHHCEPNDLNLTTCPRSFKFETDKRAQTHAKSSSSKAGTSTTTTSSSNCSVKSFSHSPMPIYQAGRTNLAATLRSEWSRKKIRSLSAGQPPIVRPMEPKPKRIDWGVRKSHAWKSLYFDGTNEEDISFRLATRRAEQRLHQQEHDIKMEMMRQRVKAAPLLLEGPSFWMEKVGKVSHDCAREAAKIEQQIFKKKSKHRSCSKLSNCSSVKTHSSFVLNDENPDDLESVDRALL